MNHSCHKQWSQNGTKMTLYESVLLKPLACIHTSKYNECFTITKNFENKTVFIIG